MKKSQQKIDRGRKIDKRIIRKEKKGRRKRYDKEKKRGTIKKCL
jgi:hypothetical protein